MLVMLDIILVGYGRYQTYDAISFDTAGGIQSEPEVAGRLLRGVGGGRCTGEIPEILCVLGETVFQSLPRLEET